MAQDPSQGAPAPAQGDAQQDGAGSDPMAQFKQMVGETDQNIAQISQLLSQISPDFGKAMGQLQQQFRSIVESAMQQAQSGKQAATAPQPAQQGAAQAQPAY